MEEKYKENAFFGGIGKEDLDQLDLPIRECVVEEGQVLFEEDSKARDLYLIVSGSIEI